MGTPPTRPLSRRVRRHTGQILRAALTGSDEALLLALSAGDMAALLDAAKAHRVEAVLRSRLWCLSRRGPGLPLGAQDLLRTLSADVDREALRRLRLLADLRRALDIVDGAGIACLVVKGPALAEFLYPRPELRRYSDIDLVVPPQSFPSALEALAAAGCPVLDQNWTRIRETMAGEVHVRMPLGSLVDLHWTVLFHRTLREEFSLRVAEWFDRADAVTTPVGLLTTTCPSDTLVHLCLHAMSDGGHRLSSLYDVHLRVASGVDWPDVVDVARRWRLGLVVAGMLGRCRSVLGTPVPSWVLHDLSPSLTWRCITAASDRLSPVDRAGTRGSLARMVARSTRSDARTSLQRLGRQALSASRHADRWLYTTQLTSPVGLDLVRTGGGADDARDAFLGDVVAEGRAKA